MILWQGTSVKGMKWKQPSERANGSTGQTTSGQSVLIRELHGLARVTFVKNIKKFFRELLYALIEMMKIIEIILANTGIIRNQSRVAEKTPVLAIG
jgi:hypothetical protein